MLTVEEFIEKIHKNPQSYFFYTLESIIDSEISHLQDYLKDETLWGINPTLFSEIQESLQKLKQNPSCWHRILSVFIPVDTHKEFYKKKLSILFDTLNTNIYKINLTIEENNTAITSVENTITYLQELKEKLMDNKFLLKEIDDKIILLKGYNVTLSFKKVNLLELKNVYHSLKIKGLR